MGYRRGPHNQFRKGQQAHRSSRPEPVPHMTRDRICVSTWAFHTQFENGEIRLLDFPEMIADRYDVHNLEIVAPHFGDADPAALHQKLDRARSRMINIPIDIKELWETPSLSSPDDAVRNRAIGLYSAWIDRASSLGVP